ncbi:cytochrome c biogenesis heme-transporting ATPase CcmA [Salinicola corii]|uniref:Cytochrome c biogenesis heme-transporting ATPase CcmA n=1 Tax=Salinicola corii TaxID=2606937 RepID=A0A640W7F2_9GAMM|nr:cytochrome c biogenesis heme-transporting ATPase CcmA [Salinicola corii]KAA0015848.1 cytochrome c biogenesis heme-transporting ATPase CcmA [Salinicola corii]
MGVDVSLQASQLASERDDRWLFRSLELRVEDGDILRIEGGNGSGKTTLLKLLTGQLQASEGRVEWHGRSLASVREHFLDRLLYLGHRPGVSGALSAQENLAWSAAMAGVKARPDAIEAALDAVGLAGFEDLPARQLSAGQQRRIALARLELIPRPLWILDEPFTAIDRDGVAWLECRLLDHAWGGGTVVMTTHHAFQANDRVDSLVLGEMP